VWVFIGLTGSLPSPLLKSYRIWQPGVALVETMKQAVLAGPVADGDHGRGGVRLLVAGRRRDELHEVLAPGFRRQPEACGEHVLIAGTLDVADPQLRLRHDRV